MKAKIERGPPVAATTAVTSAVSSRQTSQAMRVGLATGEKAASAPEVSTTASSVSASTGRLASGMRSSGSSGPMASRSAATASRANPKARNSLLGSESVIPPGTHPAGYLISVTILKIGRYIAMTMPPTDTPRNTIIIGSSSEVSAPTAASTSSS